MLFLDIDSAELEDFRNQKVTAPLKLAIVTHNGSKIIRFP